MACATVRDIVGILHDDTTGSVKSQQERADTLWVDLLE